MDCPPFGIETMLRTHYMQQWLALPDPSVKRALHVMPVFREFAGLEKDVARLPNETAILAASAVALLQQVPSLSTTC